MEDNTYFCINCNKRIPIHNQALHEIRCLSSTTRQSTNRAQRGLSVSINTQSLTEGELRDLSLQNSVSEKVCENSLDDSTQQWTCKTCTLLNEQDLKRCTACDASRDNPLIAENEIEGTARLYNNPVQQLANETLNTSNTTPDNIPLKRISTIEVCLIRHAQSDENVKIYGFLEMINSLLHFKWPEVPIFETLCNSLSLLVAEDDSPLSPLGKRQTNDMQMILRSSGFWTSPRLPDIIAYSPLSRARDTLRRCLPTPEWEASLVRCETDRQFHENANINCDGKDQKLPVFLCLESLREANRMEHIPVAVANSTFINRIASFENWLTKLATQGYNGKPVHRIVVVGHSVYFRTLLKQSSLFRNNDVKKCVFKVEYEGGTTVSTGDPKVLSISWGLPILLHRSQLSVAHPLDSLRGTDDNDPPYASTVQTEPRGEETHEEVENDLTTDGEDAVKQCRICQATTEEEPSLQRTLIRPCRCTGSQQYVHIDCLNRWRATGELASSTCSVCKYQYKIHTPIIASTFTSPNGLLTITFITTLFVACLCGTILLVFSQLRGVDVAALLYSYVDFSEVYPNINRFGQPTNNSWLVWWRYCTEAPPQEHEHLFYVLQNPQISLTLLHKLQLMWHAHFRWMVTAPLATHQDLLHNHHAFIPTYLCNYKLSWWMDSVTVGLAFTAFLGLLSFVFFRLRRIYDLHQAGQELRAGDTISLVMTAVTIYTHATSLGSGRLAFIFGIFIACSEIYSYLRIQGTKVASRLGETVLPFDTSSNGIENQ